MAKPDEEKRSFKPLIYAAAAFIAAFIGMQVYDNLPTGLDPNTGSSAGKPNYGPQPTAADHLRSEMPAPVADVITINDTTVNGIQVPAGMSTCFVPTGKRALSYEYYIDGHYACTYKADGRCVNREGKPVDPISSVSKDHTEGWRLEQGQGIRENGLAYVVFMGPTPEQKVWYPMALAASGNRD